MIPDCKKFSLSVLNISAIYFHFIRQRMIMIKLRGSVYLLVTVACGLQSLPARVFEVDYRGLISRADITYNKPVSRSEEGLPIGNGRMGSLVWTTPAALKLQINRPDVFAANRSTNSFPRRHTDYASGCGYVDINLVDYGDEVFSGTHFQQHLSVYDAVMTLAGTGITMRLLAWYKQDVLAIEINDQRQNPSPIHIDLRMLRYLRQYFLGENYELTKRHEVKMQTANQTASAQLLIRDGYIILSQEFRENDYYNTSAVAVGISGRESRAVYYNETTVRLSAKPGNGRFVILIASAASFDPNQNIGELATNKIVTAAALQFQELLADNTSWWHDFWSRSFVSLHSRDGAADYVEKNYTYFLYVMASSSRGAYPPRYGGMLWYTNGDMREWGSQHWWWNMSCYYNALPPVDRFELMDPVFDMYSDMYQSCVTAARQQWGSQGIWLPETVWFDGLEELPEDIAVEMRDLYLIKKSWEDRSERFRRYADTKLKHNSRWNWGGVGHFEQGHWIYGDKGAGPFGHVTHMLSPTARIAYLFWLRYEYTQDMDWLRDRAYPMLRGTAEFYRNFPNLEKGSDGKYHIYHTNNREGNWDSQDTQEDISAMHGIIPILIRASQILKVDSDMRPVWQEFYDNLSPLPTSDRLDSREEGNIPYWISAVSSAIPGHGRAESPDLVPALCYDLCTVAGRDEEIFRIGNNSFDRIYPDGINEQTPVNTLTENAVAAAYLGRAKDLEYMIPNQIRGLTPDKDYCDWEGVGKVGVLSNRLSLREGPGAIDCQRLGRAAAALHAALLQSGPAHPAMEDEIHLFPAWPVEWDATFCLLARGAFMVSAAIMEGNPRVVEIKSKSDRECRLSNPWPGKILSIYRNGVQPEEMAGSLLKIPMKKDEVITIVPQGSILPGKIKVK